MRTKGTEDAWEAHQEEVWPPPPTKDCEADTATVNQRLAKMGAGLMIGGTVAVLLSIVVGVFFTVGEAGRLINHDSRFPSLTLRDEIILTISLAFLTLPFNLGSVVGVLLVMSGIFY